jgi:hypothetical protein
MKKILQTTILVALFFLSLNASAKSKLSISTTMQTAMKVIIDGQKFYSQDNRICINNLLPGYHNITVYYIKNGRDFNNYYNNGSNGYWKKAVSRQVTVRNNYQYDITINRFGRAFYDQDFYYGNNNWDNNNDDENSYNDFDYNNGYDENYDDWDYFKRGAKQTNTNQNNDHLNNDNRNNHNSYSNLPLMSNTIFAQVKQTIQQQNFSSSKLEFAKQSIDKNSITTAQTKELINMLTMQSDKLEFAKYAYKNVSNKNDYFTVANSLLMQSDKDDLLKYIKDKK